MEQQRPFLGIAFSEWRRLAFRDKLLSDAQRESAEMSVSNMASSKPDDALGENDKVPRRDVRYRREAVTTVPESPEQQHVTFSAHQHWTGSEQQCHTTSDLRSDSNA